MRTRRDIHAALKEREEQLAALGKKPTESSRHNQEVA
jgi:hypothetical protein